MLRSLITAVTGYQKVVYCVALRAGTLNTRSNKPALHHITNSCKSRLIADSRILYKMAENRYSADYAKVGTSSCKKCKQKLEKGSFRIAKVSGKNGGTLMTFGEP